MQAVRHRVGRRSVVHPCPYFTTHGLHSLSCILFLHSIRQLASNSQTEAEDVVRGLSNASTYLIDIEDRQTVSRLVEDADIVIRWVYLDSMTPNV